MMDIGNECDYTEADEYCEEDEDEEEQVNLYTRRKGIFPVHSGSAQYV